MAATATTWAGLALDVLSDAELLSDVLGEHADEPETPTPLTEGLECETHRLRTRLDRFDVDRESIVRVARIGRMAATWGAHAAERRDPLAKHILSSIAERWADLERQLGRASVVPSALYTT